MNNKEREPNNTLPVGNSLEWNDNETIPQQNLTLKQKIRHKLQLDIDDYYEEQQDGETSSNNIIDPSPDNSSSYCYEDDHSTVFTPLSTPTVGPSDSLRRLVCYHNHIGEQSPSSQSVLIDQEDDIDKVSIDSSFMDYSLTYLHHIEAANERSITMYDSTSPYSNENNTLMVLHNSIDPLEECFNDENNIKLTRFHHVDNCKVKESNEVVQKPTMSTTSSITYEEMPQDNHNIRTEYIHALYRRLVATSNENTIHEQRRWYDFSTLAERNIKGIKIAGGNHNRDRKFSLPAWIIDSPPTIKCIIILSSLVLVGSLVLIAMALSVSVGPTIIDSSQQKSVQATTNAPTATAYVLPLVYPTTTPSKMSTLAPSRFKSLLQPSLTSSISSVVFPSSTPSKMSTFAPSLLKTSSSQPSIEISTQRPQSSNIDGGEKSQQIANPSFYPSTEHSRAPSNVQTIAPSMSISTTPSEHLSVSNTSKPSYEPTNNSTLISTTEVLSPSIGKFFITSRMRQRASLLPLLPRLPKGNAEWMIHLGNWNQHSKQENRCNPKRYEMISETFRHSSVPVFLLPGDYEWNDCDDFPASVTTWRNTFVDFEMNWSPLPFKVFRQKARMENFSFVHEKVMYFGLNMVGGLMEDINQSQWSNRLRSNLRWVKNGVRRFFDKIELVIIFGSTGSIDVNKDFFMHLEVLVKQWNSEYVHDINTGEIIRRKLPVLYIKESDNESAIDFMGESNLILVNIRSGIWPPAKVSVDTRLNQFSFKDEW